MLTAAKCLTTPSLLKTLQEVDLSITNNSHVAGITLTQGYEWEDIISIPVTAIVIAGIAGITHPAADNAMQTTATFDNSTLMGDVFFSSNFDENFFPHGRDSYRDADGDVDTNG